VASIQAIPKTNRLLAALPIEAQQLMLAGCELIELRLADVLDNRGDTMRYVYFPIDSVISLVMPIHGDSGLGVGLIGNEGMLGTPLLLGIDVAPFHAVIQKAGSVLRMAVPAFLHELEQNPTLLQLLKYYLHVVMSQLVQTSSCHRYHLIEARLARLLLMIRDRVHTDTFHFTQELLSQLLGVRRVGVTKAAGSLQKKKLIGYSRGNVRIYDVSGLEATSCSCYQTDKETYNRILHC